MSDQSEIIEQKNLMIRSIQIIKTQQYGLQTNLEKILKQREIIAEDNQNVKFMTAQQSLLETKVSIIKMLYEYLSGKQSLEILIDKLESYLKLNLVKKLKIEQIEEFGNLDAFVQKIIENLNLRKIEYALTSYSILLQDWLRCQEGYLKLKNQDNTKQRLIQKRKSTIVPQMCNLELNKIKEVIKFINIQQKNNGLIEQKDLILSRIPINECQEYKKRLSLKSYF